ncbi:MAG: LysM peptidoglycan-binding domain-containing protein [Caldilineaceae bacterium]|nr:LysM peptidoglycan-binding domain-containing protein [Caldilineaceae bacterium]
MTRHNLSISIISHRAAYRAARHIFALALLLAMLLVTARAVYAQSSPTHTIEPGETLSQIAERYGIPLAELMELNSISDPDAIVSGQILVLPTPADAEPAPAIEVDEPFNAEETAPIEHLIQPGESLSRIAEMYDLTMDELMEINGISDPDTIVIGQRLRLTPVIATEAAQPDAPTPLPASSGNPIATLNRTYTVAAGDSVPYIALRFGVDESALRQINNLDGSTLLDLGQVLILPATAQELHFAPVERETETDEEETESAAAEGSPRYTVQAGDSLGHIAQDQGLSLAALMEANQISNPDAIYVGQELLIPPSTPTDVTGEQAQNAGLDSAAEAASPKPIGRQRSGFFYYTVKPGDTLSELAREFDSTQLALLEYNNLPDIETVFAGLELRIPYGPPPLPMTAPPIPFSGSRFVVSLSRQQCWVLEGETVRYTWNCSTGYGEWITRTGNFAVQTKMEMAKSTAYELDMPYWLGIYDVGTYENGIHGLPIRWETGEKIWEGLIGQPATFGCAMLDDEDAATLFDLAFLGMPVHIVP